MVDRQHNQIYQSTTIIFYDVFLSPNPIVFSFFVASDGKALYIAVWLARHLIVAARPDGATDLFLVRGAQAEGGGSVILVPSAATSTL
jgi:hypothetical protein